MRLILIIACWRRSPFDRYNYACT